ncbi:MAG: 7-cyano-7-deazaguanine synthase QueC [Bdellovibrionaceae bacterium]|nr:7-cyano-7-deazaguanine synthase QueC [Pseudobdellovibrionaceae bacterium]|tara:strand:+ start:18661 stop:19323 length:663 start_codon:yes stop_codon:yes gene_type:complete
MSNQPLKYVVLLSGGLDSTVNLYVAHRGGEVLLALTANYGQRAFKKEAEAAQVFARDLGVPHKIIDLSWFKDFTNTSLVNADSDVPTGSDVSIDDMAVSGKTAERVWVPNRNGILLNIAAGFAEGLGAHAVVPGFNIEEAATFPDNSSDYMEALDRSFFFSTSSHVKVQCFTDQLNKTEIVKLGRELKIDLDQIWSCYFDQDTRCGECESCQRFERAVKA